jgi:signal transduction histidine kinase
MPGGKNVTTIALETGRPARIDDFADASGPIGVAAREAGYRSAVGTPIVVEGRLWGVMTAASWADDALPADTEARLANFTELLATAIANAESRAGLARLAAEQAALQRVATLVARAVPPEEVFSTVTEELGRLLGADISGLIRLEPGNTALVLAVWGAAEGDYVPVGTRIPVEDSSVPMMVGRTGRPARRDIPEQASDATSVRARKLGITSTVGAPIVVEGRLWGGMSVCSKQADPLPPNTESRIAAFAELVATAIANAEARTELAASRARVVATADETRRRLERNLHDGAQQRLVSLALQLRAAEATASERKDVGVDLSRIGEELDEALEDLRKISHGLHPAILSEGGLEPALKTLARRSAVPVELDVRIETRLPEGIEVAAYYVVSEGLANAVKHADASVAKVEVEAVEDNVCLSIWDDGRGGADPARGSGLIGLKDRVEAQGGTISVVSPPDEGTRLHVSLPVGAAEGAAQLTDAVVAGRAGAGAA